MKCYIGAKIIQAEPMNLFKWQEKQAAKGALALRVTDDKPGYLVRYPDGYESWSPKDVFEEAYREVNPREKELVA